MILLILIKDLFHVYVDNYHVILQISLNQNLPISVEYEVIINWVWIAYNNTFLSMMFFMKFYFKNLHVCILTLLSKHRQCRIRRISHLISYNLFDAKVGRTTRIWTTRIWQRTTFVFVFNVVNYIHSRHTHKHVCVLLCKWY